MGRRATAPRDRVVSTFWLSDRERDAGKKPIVHVYGPYTLHQARQAKKRFEAEPPPEPGYHAITVCRVMDVVDGEVFNVVSMETESRGLAPAEGGQD